ncbi:MAG: TIGR01777 family oxidoreductase [Pseudomonadota bacterium]
MNWLVLGGTGYIGQHLIQALRSPNQTIWVYTRSVDNARKIWKNGEVKLIADFTELGETKIDIVLNFSGAPIADKRWTQARKDVLRKSRVTLTQQLFEHFKAFGSFPELLISASAIGFYGNQKDNRVTEDTKPHLEFTHELCAAWEEAALSFQEQGVRVVIPRLGVVVGKNSGFMNKLLPLFRLNLGGVMGGGNQWVSWVHISDIIHFVAQAVQRDDFKGIYNLTAPNPVTNRDMTQSLARVLKRKAILPVPSFTMKLFLGEMSNLLLEGQKVIPSRLLDEAKLEFKYTSIDEAFRDAV